MAQNVVSHPGRKKKSNNSSYSQLNSLYMQERLFKCFKYLSACYDHMDKTYLVKK